MARYYTYVGKMIPSRWEGSHYIPEQRGVGLLFADNEGLLTEKDQRAALASPTVRELFNGVAFAIPVAEDQFVVTSSDVYVPMTPDQATLEHKVLIAAGNETKELALRQRYNACASLLKATVGCAHCPERGAKCLSDYVFQLSNAKGAGPERRVLQKTAQGAREIAGFSFISPTMTSSKYFAKSFRPPTKHEFNEAAIDDWRELFRDRALEAARTRAFKRDECARCPVVGSCGKWSNQWGASRCRGALAPAEELTTTALLNWMPRVEDKQLNPFEPWQFWTMARLAGREGRWRGNESRHRRALFEGVRYTCGRWEATGCFMRGSDAGYDTIRTQDYAEIAEKFSLPATKTDAVHAGQVPGQDEALALWFASQDFHHGPRCGGFCQSSHSITFRRLTRTGAELGVAFARFAGDWTRHHVDSWRGLWEVGDRSLKNYAVRVRDLEERTHGEGELRAA